MTVQHDETGEWMDATDKDIAFITGEGVGEPLGVLPGALQRGIKDVVVRNVCEIPVFRDFHREFDEMAASLEEQLCEEVPLIDVRVLRWQESCDGGMPPSVFSVVGEVTINGKPFKIDTAVAVEMWRSYLGHPLEFLIHKMASKIAEVIVEYRPKEAAA